MNSAPTTSSLLPANLSSARATEPQAYALAIPVSSLPNFMAGQTGMVPSQASATKNIVIEDLVRCIFRRWKAALIVAGSIAGLLLILMLGRQPQYLAEANLMMRMHDDKVFNFDKVVNNTGGESNSILYMLNNHRVEMKSRRFLDFFYSRLAPTERDAFVAPPARPTVVSQIFDKLSSTPPPISGRAEDQAKQPFMKLCETVGVDFIKETLILKVSVKHHSPEQAASLANAWVKAYVEYVGHEDGASTRSASVFLRQEADQAKQRVQLSEEKLAAYCREKGLVADEEQAAGDSEKLRLLSAEQARCEIELSQVKQTLSQVEAAQNNVEQLLAVEGFSAIPALTTLRGQLADKLREKEIIEQRYLPKHPAVRSFQKGFGALNQEISSALNRAVSELRNKEQSLTAKVGTLNEQTGKTKGTVAGQGQENIERKMLRSQLASDRALYDKILSRLDEATVSSRFGEVTHLRTAEVAVPPEKAVAPSKPLSVVLAGVSFSALFIMVPLLMAAIGVLRLSGFEGLLEKLRASTVAPGALPTVAAAPMAEPNPGLPALMPSQGVWLGEIPPLPVFPSGRPDEMLFSAFRTSALVKHLFDGTAHHVLAESNRARPQAPVVFVTSTRPSEGKSLVASALGIATALQMKTVIVIDGNLRRPSLHRYFPREIAPPSLSEAAHSQQSEPWQIESLRYPGSNLFTMEAGNCRGLDVEHVFDSKWFAKMLNHLRSTVDLVILDAPSLSEVPESEQLAMLATRAIVVASAAHQSREDLQSISTRLCQLAPHLTSADYILNRVG